MMGGGLILLVIVLVLVVWVLIKFFPDWQDRVCLNSGHEDSAEEILRRRFARGEINAEEYERSLEVLRNEKVSENRKVSENNVAKEV